MKAKQNVMIAVAWFDFDIFTSTFSELLSRGVKLTILTKDDKKIEKYYDTILSLKKLGAEIDIVKMKRFINCMHNKFCIIDRSVLINGSHNWTHNAQLNFENISISAKPFDVILRYEYEFNRIKTLNRLGLKNFLNYDKCPTCKSDLLNTVIFHNDIGHIVKICSGSSDHYINTNQVVNNKLLHLISYTNSKYELELQSGIDEYSFSVMSSNPIHAVGAISIATDYYFEGELYVNFFWFSKFSSSKIENEYFDLFDII